MVDNDKKKMKFAVRMISKGGIEDNTDIPLDSNTFPSKTVHRIIDWTCILSIIGKLN